ncbi:uncharacterized protein PFL1_05685 [Pseudozyma flocculosa PF-1]|uniref:Transmembrane protein n=1 Tax=Pseudozyma flocculosa PF-1 TaxID=1277687 RepID=A0A061H7X2_9BASI|nr:uncharacterized protein PFL1_05685 [Pseudozyma flocculosa PF-1]EPQ26706.1 hypothetical protein PFL1_05685 [Pseudozyma flocculosa PF-1]
MSMPVSQFPGLPVLNNSTVAGLTLYGWEFLSTLIDEIHIYKTPSWRSPQVILFALNRCVSLAAMILSAYATWSTSTRKPCLPYLCIAIGMVMIPAISIFSWRTVAIWRRDRRIIRVMATMSTCLFILAAGVVGTADYRTRPEGGCVSTVAVRIDASLVLLSGMIVYELVVVVLITAKLWENHRMGTSEARAASSRFPTTPPPTLSERRRAKGATAVMRWSRAAMHWVRMQSHLSTALVFRLATNGMLYCTLVFACLAVSLIDITRGDPRYPALMVPLLSPLLCVICQRLMLLEIRGVGRRRHRWSWEGDSSYRQGVRRSGGASGWSDQPRAGVAALRGSDEAAAFSSFSPGTKAGASSRFSSPTIEAEEIARQRLMNLSRVFEVGCNHPRPSAARVGIPSSSSRPSDLMLASDFSKVRDDVRTGSIPTPRSQTRFEVVWTTSTEDTETVEERSCAATLPSSSTLSLQQALTLPVEGRARLHRHVSFSNPDFSSSGQRDGDAVRRTPTLDRPGVLACAKRAGSVVTRALERVHRSRSGAQRHEGDQLEELQMVRIDSRDELAMRDDPALHWSTIQQICEPTRSRERRPTANELVSSMSHEARMLSLRMAGLDAAHLVCDTSVPSNLCHPSREADV